jgi:hypothetical protein
LTSEENQGAYDSTIINAVPSSDVGQILDYELVVLNENKAPSTPGYKYQVNMKKVSDYILTFNKNPDANTFSKLFLNCVSSGDDVFKVNISDFIEAPAKAN